MSDTKEMNLGNPLGYKPIGKLLTEFAVPSTIAILINAVYNIVDQIFIGHGVGYLGNAATTVAFPILMIVMAFSTMLGTGGSAYAAIKLGEKREEKAEAALNNTLILSLAAGASIAVIGFIFLKPLLRMFGATDTVMPYAWDYASVLLIGVPFSILGPCLANFARTDGKPQLSMYGILIGAILNTILDPLYIFVFGWGVKGAALATITSQLISATVMCVYFTKYGSLRFHKDKMKLDPDICKKMLTLGISAGLTQIVSCVMQVIMNNTLNYYGAQSEVGGDVALSSMGIVMKITMIMLSICLGIGAGAQTIFGYNFGSKQYDRIKKTLNLAIFSATVSLLIGWAICEIFPRTIIQLFGGGDSNFMEFAVRCLRIYPGAIFVVGVQAISTSYFQATGQPMKAAIVSLLRQMIFLVPLLIILPIFFGLSGVLFAGPITDVITTLVVIVLLIPEMKKLNKEVEEETVQTEQ